MQKIHIDTDIGGDIDDLCALVMLLRWPDVQITGITTVAEDNGRRAGFVDYLLTLANRRDIPVAAGAEVAAGYYRYASLGYPPDDVNWPGGVTRHTNPLDETLDLLKRSIDQDAILVGIGPFTNFRLLDEKYPGSLARARLVLMGGFVYDIPDGYRQFSKQDDYNIQVDVPSALHVLRHAHPLLVPLDVACQTALRRSYVPRLLESGPLGALIGRQAEYFAETEHWAEQFGATCARYPADIVNCQYDPLACAIALGWDRGVDIAEVPLRFEVRDTFLYERPDPVGRPTRIVIAADGDAFNEDWLSVVCG